MNKLREGGSDDGIRLAMRERARDAYHGAFQDSVDGIALAFAPDDILCSDRRRHRIIPILRKRCPHIGPANARFLYAKRKKDENDLTP